MSSPLILYIYDLGLLTMSPTWERAHTTLTTGFHYHLTFFLRHRRRDKISWSVYPRPKYFNKSRAKLLLLDTIWWYTWVDSCLTHKFWANLKKPVWDTVGHSLSQFVTVCHSLSQFVTICHCGNDEEKSFTKLTLGVRFGRTFPICHLCYYKIS
jgi:hypothetical protein